MTDLYQNFKRFEKDLASEQRARPRRRLDKVNDRLAPWEIATAPQTDKYREGWDRIFGNKTRNPVQDEGEA